MKLIRPLFLLLLPHIVWGNGGVACAHVAMFDRQTLIDGYVGYDL